MDFKLDADGDLDIEGGLTLITSYEEEAAQRLGLALSLNLGEWFAYNSFGLPWIKNNKEDFSEDIRYMLGDKFPDTPRFIAGVLDEFILDQPYVDDVSSTYIFDRATRKFSYTPNATLLNGGTLGLEPFQLDL